MSRRSEGKRGQPAAGSSRSGPNWPTIAGDSATRGMSATRGGSAPLAPWMTRLLWFVGGYNLLAGLGIAVFYHEGFKLLGIPKPTLLLPTQLVGVMVGLFGVGYWMVARDPLANRGVLLLGFWSKALGATLGVWHVANNRLPTTFLWLLLAGDVVYLPPFLIILRRLKHALDAAPNR